MTTPAASSPEVYMSVEEIAAEIDYQNVLLISLDDSQEDRGQAEAEIKAEIVRLGKCLRATQQEQRNPKGTMSAYMHNPYEDNPFALSPARPTSKPEMATGPASSTSSTPDSSTPASAMSNILGPSRLRLPTRKRSYTGHLDVNGSEPKFRRTSPSPHITRSTTPSSVSGQDQSIGGHEFLDLTVNDGGIREELAKARQRQKEAEERANRERDDAEYARMLQEQFSGTAAPTGSAFSQYAAPAGVSAFDRILGRTQSSMSHATQSRLPAVTPAFNPHHYEPSSDSEEPLIKPYFGNVPQHVPGAFQESESDSDIEIISTNTLTQGSGHSSLPVLQQQAANMLRPAAPERDQRQWHFDEQMAAMQYGQQAAPGAIHAPTMANSGMSAPQPYGTSMPLAYPGQHHRGLNNVYAHSSGISKTPGSSANSFQNYPNFGQQQGAASSSGLAGLSEYDSLGSMILETSAYGLGQMLDIHGNPVDPRMAELNTVLGGRLGEINDYVADPRRTAKEIQDLLENIRPDTEIPKENREGTPEGLKYSLYEHQKLSLTWLRQMEEGTNKGGILADDMGLGKTISALALILSRPSQDRLRKTTLIVGPVALVRQWEREIQTKISKSHRLSTFLYHSGKKNTWENLRTYDIVLTTYGTIGAELKRHQDWEKKCSENPNLDQSIMKNKFPFLGANSMWYRVILDEAQCIKNKNTKAAQGCCYLKSLTRFCLTGTPMMNGVHELYSLIHFLRIKPYNEYSKFVSDFGCLSKAGGARGATHPRMEQNAMKRLQAVLKAILLRRTKSSQIDGKPILTLPEKTEEVIHAIFNEDEQAYYTALETKTRVQFNKYVKANTIGKNYSNILVLLLRLRQAACHPHLIMDFEEASPDVSPEDMTALAKTLTPDVIRRIVEATLPFQCPVCYDPVPNPRIVIPCGHDTCAECLVKITGNVEQAIAEGDEAGQAKCPTCRGKIETRKVIDYLTFKRVYMEKADAPGDDSETDTDDGDSIDDSSDTESIGSESGGSDEDIRNFVVPDGYASSNEAVTDDGDEHNDDEVGDVEESVQKTISNGHGNVKNRVKNEPQDEGKAEDRVSYGTVKKENGGVKDEVKYDDDDDLVDIKDIEPCNKAEPASRKRSMKAKSLRSKRRLKDKRKKQDKGKSRAGPKERVPKHFSLAMLKKEASRSVEAHRRYMRYLRKNWISSAKVDKCLELLKDTDPSVKTIVFSQFTTLLDLVEIPIRQEKWGFMRYDGSMSADARNHAVVAFTDDPRCKIMLVSLKAGNAGLNLVAASQVIILDPFWNPFIEMQAVDRAHRIGQQKPVKVHRILVAKTVEDRIIELQNKKRQLVEAALDEKASQGLGRLGRSELIYLFNGGGERETAARPPHPFALGPDNRLAAPYDGSNSSP